MVNSGGAKEEGDGKQETINKEEGRLEEEEEGEMEGWWLVGGSKHTISLKI